MTHLGGCDEGREDYPEYSLNKITRHINSPGLIRQFHSNDRDCYSCLKIGGYARILPENLERILEDSVFFHLFIQTSGIVGSRFSTYSLQISEVTSKISHQNSHGKKENPGR